MPCLHLADEQIHRLGKCPPLPFPNPRMQILDLGLLLAYEVDQADVLALGRPGITNELGIELKQARLAFRVELA